MRTIFIMAASTLSSARAAPAGAAAPLSLPGLFSSKSKVERQSSSTFAMTLVQKSTDRLISALVSVPPASTVPWMTIRRYRTRQFGNMNSYCN